MYLSSKEEWYAIRVKSRFEEIVKKSLQAKNFSPLYLTYQEASRRKDRKKILTKAFFPGYMFVKTLLNTESHLEVLKTIGVVDFIKNESGPVPILEDQIENVIKLEKFTGKILSLPGFSQGMLVKIIHGPLEGLIGKVDEIKRNFINISIDSIPNFISLSVSPDLLEPIDAESLLSSRIALT